MSDSYTVTPSLVPYPFSGNVVVQYNSINVQSGKTYNLKNALGTTLKSTLYNTTPSSFTPAQLNSTIPIAVSPSGNIYAQANDYAGTTSNQTIYIYNFAGTNIGNIPASDWYFAFFTDVVNNKIYCAGVGTFGIINLSTNILTTYSSAWLNGVALGSDGYVYATTNSGYKIQKINPANGTQTNIFTSSGGNITSDSYGTFGGCAMDSNGFIYCVTRGVGYIYKFNTSGTLLGRFATLNSSYGGPFGITCNQTTNDLYVTTNGAEGAIYKITSSGTISVFTTSIGPSSYGIFYDSVSSNLFVADSVKIYIYPLGAANSLSFSFLASNLSQGTNILQIYDSSGNAFGNSITVNAACFLEGTMIRCLDYSLKRELYLPVEHLTKDTFVRTHKHGYKRVEVIGYSTIYNPSAETVIDNRLFCYKAGPTNPTLFEDLYVTGNHCVLLEELSEDLKKRVECHMGDIYKTEGLYRLPACLDERACPHVKPGECKIWHFALENDNIYENYGVIANGLWVESSSIRYMTELSKMTLVE